MKTRLGNLLNDLNISLDNATERLKKLSKEYSLNTVVSEEDIKILYSYGQSRREKNKSKEKTKANNKLSPKPLSLKKPMTRGQSFDSSASDFIINYISRYR